MDPRPNDFPMDLDSLPSHPNDPIDSNSEVAMWMAHAKNAGMLSTYQSSFSIEDMLNTGGQPSQADASGYGIPVDTPGYMIPSDASGYPSYIPSFESSFSRPGAGSTSTLSTVSSSGSAFSACDIADQLVSIAGALRNLPTSLPLPPPLPPPQPPILRSSIDQLCRSLPIFGGLLPFMASLAISSAWWRAKNGYELLEAFQDQNVLATYAFEAYACVLNAYKKKRGSKPVEPSYLDHYAIVQQFLKDQILNEIDDLKSTTTQWLSKYGFTFENSGQANNVKLFKSLSKNKAYLRDPKATTPTWHTAITNGFAYYFYFRDNAIAKRMNEVRLALGDNFASKLFLWTHEVPKNALSVYLTSVRHSMKELSTGKLKPEPWGEPDIKYARSASAFLRDENNGPNERPNSMAAFNSLAQGAMKVLNLPIAVEEEHLGNAEEVEEASDSDESILDFKGIYN